VGRFEDEARKEIGNTDNFARWMKARVEAIHNKVSAADVLAENGIRLRYGGARAEQVFCPFHGNTRTMAARYHPEEGTSRAGIWCFGCNKRFDAITLWKEFRGFEGSFGSLLRSMERAYGLTPPEAPPEGAIEEAAEDYELGQLFDACEHRLKNAKHAFKMDSFLTVASLLDRLYFRVEKGTIVLTEAKAILRKILDKVGAKERECPVG